MKAKYALAVNFVEGGSMTRNLYAQTLKEAEEEGRLEFKVAVWTGSFGSRQIENAGIIHTDDIVKD